MTTGAKLAHQDVPGHQSQLSSLSTPATTSVTSMPHGAGGRRDGETTAMTATGSAVTAIPKNNNSDHFVKRYRTEIAASTSSVFSTLAAFPLDSVKTRMQTYHYKGFLDCVRQTYHAEKLGGFFRGMAWSIDRFCLIQVANPTYRRYSSDGKHYACSYRLFLDLSTCQILLFSLGQAQPRIRHHRSCQPAWHIP